MMMIYLSIYGLDHSQSKPHYEFRKKISNTTDKNDNTLETTKKEMEMQKQNWGGHW